MSKFFTYLALVISFILMSCDPPHRPIQTDTKEEKISGRNGVALYQADVPLSWKRVDPKEISTLNDTTKAICEFFIEDPAGTIRITVHNFPSISLDQRIPPEAQILRWKNQIKGKTSETAVAHDGFGGYFFQGKGVIENKEATVLGWAMQLSPIHYQAITSKQPIHYDQMRADYTIKAVGPSELMSRHQSEITHFADSFRLIKEIPSQT